MRVPSVGERMTRCLVYIDAEAGIHEAQAEMEQHGVRHLPVTEQGDLVGLITDRDLRLSLDPMLGLPPMRKVRDIMIDEPYIVDVAEPLDRVLATLAEQRIGSVLVTEHDKLVGIFTTTDAARLLVEIYRRADL